MASVVQATSTTTYSGSFDSAVTAGSTVFLAVTGYGGTLSMSDPLLGGSSVIGATDLIQAYPGTVAASDIIAAIWMLPERCRRRNQLFDHLHGRGACRRHRNFRLRGRRTRLQSRAGRRVVRCRGQQHHSRVGGDHPPAGGDEFVLAVAVCSSGGLTASSGFTTQTMSGSSIAGYLTTAPAMGSQPAWSAAASAGLAVRTSYGG